MPYGKLNLACRTPGAASAPGLPLGHMRADALPGLHRTACRAAPVRIVRVGADAERKLDVYRDYLYHLDQVRGTHSTHTVLTGYS